MKNKLTYILPLLTGAMWGSSGTFVRRLSDFGADTFTVLASRAMKYGEAGKVSIISSGTEPSAAMIFGILVFAEIPSITSFAGLVLTIIALTMLCRTEENN